MYPDRVSARPYLMTLHVNFQIHVNFPITSRCVFKATIHKKNSELKEFTGFFSMNGSFNIEKVLLQKDDFMILYMYMLYLIIFSTLS